MTSRLNGAGVISGHGVPDADIFPRASSDGTPLYLDLDSGLLYYLDDENDVQTILEPFGVGAIYLSVDSTNPNTTLGYGTWVRFSEGRMLIGLDENNALFDTPEETGGSADAVVVTHTHIQDAHAHTINNGTGVVRLSGSGSIGVGAGLNGQTSTLTAENATATNQYAGESGTNKNYPPFITVYMWKRTA